jgi:hypothetical protein
MSCASLLAATLLTACAGSVDVSTSSMHATCVLRPGGQVTCFGNSSADSPADVPGLNDATNVSGGAVGCAVRASGQVACWQGIGATPGTSGSTTPIAA